MKEKTYTLRPYIRPSLRRTAGKVLIMISLVLLSLSMLFIYAGRRIHPVLRDAALSKARNMASSIADETVLETIKNENITYDDLIVLEKDSSGKVCALKADVVKLNCLKSMTAEGIRKKFSSPSVSEMTLPLGSIVGSALGGELIPARGPDIRIGVLLSGSVAADVENVLTEAGINQTCHRIMLEISFSMTLLLPTEHIKTDVSTSVCIGETVIVGEVPEAFTQVITQSDDIPGIINDYGAQKDG